MHPCVRDRGVEIAEACRRFDVRRLSVFGSAARGADFDPGRSDVDLLVDLGPLRRPDPFLDFKQAMEGILGRRVDLLDATALEGSRNYIRRAAILNDAEVLYEQA